jgi:predicted lipoprotein with Yx(FWY)xxD motif
MKTPVLMALAAAPLFLVSACGSSSSTTASPPSGGTTPSSSANGLHVATTSLGKVLVDANGHTVYTLSADSAGKSTCSSSCLQYWPAVAPSKAASTVTATVASTSTTGGSKIATVAGWPVYTFIQDQNPGDVNGEGMNAFGGIWYAVSPSGQPVKSAGGGAPSASGSSASTYGGGGY